MYPASFEYFAPTTIEEALEILGRYDEGEAKVLAGGMSLIPVMKLRFAAPQALVDINRIAGLDTLAEDEDRLCIGALVFIRAPQMPAWRCTSSGKARKVALSVSKASPSSFGTHRQLKSIASSFNGMFSFASL